VLRIRYEIPVLFISVFWLCLYFKPFQDILILYIVYLFNAVSSAAPQISDFQYFCIHCFFFGSIFHYFLKYLLDFSRLLLMQSAFIAWRHFSFLLLKKLIFSYMIFSPFNLLIFSLQFCRVWKTNGHSSNPSSPSDRLCKKQQFKEWRTTNKSPWVTGQLMLSLFLTFSLSLSLELIWFG
jgi:hypothetical protein